MPGDFLAWEPERRMLLACRDGSNGVVWALWPRRPPHYPQSELVGVSAVHNCVSPSTVFFARNQWTIMRAGTPVFVWDRRACGYRPAFGAKGSCAAVYTTASTPTR